MATEKFAPSILVQPNAGARVAGIGPYVITPAGWMWVLAFALRGIPWAIEEASTPKFRERIREHLKQRNEKRIEAQIADYEKRIAELREQLAL